MTPAGRYFAAALVAFTGVAQMFRTETEVVIGVGFVVGALALVVATRLGDWYGVGVATGVVAVAFLARSLAGVWVADAWHGVVIMACTWGGLSLAFARSSWRTLRGVD